VYTLYTRGVHQQPTTLYTGTYRYGLTVQLYGTGYSYVIGRTVIVRYYSSTGISSLTTDVPVLTVRTYRATVSVYTYSYYKYCTSAVPVKIVLSSSTCIVQVDRYTVVYSYRYIRTCISFINSKLLRAQYSYRIISVLVYTVSNTGRCFMVLSVQFYCVFSVLVELYGIL